MRKYSSSCYLTIMSVLVLTTGCAIGNQYKYHDITADIKASGKMSVAVATSDQREYILSGGKKPNFVGLQRAGYGEPYDVSTMSGRALAGDITNDIAASLAKKGFKAMPVTALPSEPKNTLVDRLKDAKADRLILVTVKEWMSDTYQQVDLSYDVTLNIYDRNGKGLAEKKIVKQENLGGSILNPSGHARKAIPAAYQKKIEELLNSAAVVNTLK